MATPKKRLPRLGRGLSSLMSSPVQVQPMATALAEEPPATTAGSQIGSDNSGSTATKPTPPGKPVAGITEQAGLTYVPLTSLEPNRHQPRQRFDEVSLKRLSDSIKSEGVMQPIVARRIGAGNFEIVAGERRWRAAQLAGLSVIPAIVRDLNRHFVSMATSAHHDACSTGSGLGRIPNHIDENLFDVDRTHHRRKLAGGDVDLQGSTQLRDVGTCHFRRPADDVVQIFEPFRGRLMAREFEHVPNNPPATTRFLDRRLERSDRKSVV